MRSNAFLLGTVLLALAGSFGCIELQAIFSGDLSLLGNGTPLGGVGNGADGGGTGETGIPVVRLSVSNPTPQLNEEVVLTCSVLSGDDEQITFDFQPDDSRISVNTRTGTATFIIAESEIGTEFNFTCTATNSVGTSDPSNRQTIIPT